MLGSITDKELLPVTRLHFGRTALPSTSIQFTLGRLECRGRRHSSIITTDSSKKMLLPSNCDQLRSLGHRSSGFYLTVSKNSSASSSSAIKGGKIQTTFCDFTKTSRSAGN